MKIFSSSQVQAIDKFTIENEPIQSIDLMERAAARMYEWFVQRFGRSERIIIFVGPGNNGGDGLVLARLLAATGYSPEVIYVDFTEKVSSEWKVNRTRLENTDVPYSKVSRTDQFPVILEGDIVIDAILGSGLSKPVEGFPAEIIRLINRSGATVVSVDIPSGLFGEDNSNNIKDNIIRADITLSLQFPKLSFMFADCYIYTGDWHIIPIGLHQSAINDSETPYYYIEESDILPIIRKRRKFDHKGHYGHGLLVSGSYNKAGATILSAKAALRTGIGLITCHVPSLCAGTIQSALPEAMIQPDRNENIISELKNYNDFTAVGTGPGIGTDEKTIKVIEEILLRCDRPLLIDADAINITGMNRELYKMIRHGTIFTPHPKEFARMTSESDSCYERLSSQSEFSATNNCIVVLKGAHTSVSLPDGKVYFNSTGNPGMATAGSGDVLTGIILSLLAQGYGPAEAAIAGVYLHGLAGDIAAENSCQESVIASDITENIGNAFRKLWQKLI